MEIQAMMIPVLHQSPYRRGATGQIFGTSWYGIWADITALEMTVAIQEGLQANDSFALLDWPLQLMSAYQRMTSLLPLRLSPGDTLVFTVAIHP